MTSGSAPPGPSLEPSVRSATSADAEACLAIYAPVVETTVASFEGVPPTTEEMRTRIETALRTHAWVVLEEGASQARHVVGYAYAGPYKSRPAYRWSCEVSVYVDRSRQRTGAGRALYEELFARLAQRGFRVALAGMTLPNPASEGLHRALGFEDVGTWRGIGWKHGAWHDVHWMQRPLGVGSAGAPDRPALGADAREV